MTVAAVNCSPGFQTTCRPLIRKAYFPEKSAANTPVLVAAVIHMNGRIYDPYLGRMLQADPFIQFPTNTQSYNRYSYVLNNPFAYTDPSGYFSFKDLIKVAAVVAISVVTYNVASAWAANWAFYSFAPAGAVTQASVVAASANAAIVGGVVGGATAGFAAGTSIAAFSGASFEDSLKAGGRGAFAGAISGGFGAYGSSFGAFGRIASVAAGGCGAGKASGGSCKTGATYAGMAAALSVALENWSSYSVTANTAKSGAVVKEAGTVIHSEDASNMGISIFAPKGSPLIGRAVDRLSQQDLADLARFKANSDTIIGSAKAGYSVSWTSEGGRAFQNITKYLPGGNGGSVQHDFQASYFNLGPAMTKATIPPSFYLSYEAMGVRNYSYLARNLENDL